MPAILTPMVVEDGTGLPDANSYVDLNDAQQWIDLQLNYAAWDALSSDQMSQWLILASSFLDTYFIWNGYKEYAASGLRWPRTGVYDQDGNPVAADSVPLAVSRATAEMGVFLMRGERTGDPAMSGIRELKVDVIDLKFDIGTVAPAIPTRIAAMLFGYGQSRSARVSFTSRS